MLKDQALVRGRSGNSAGGFGMTGACHPLVHHLAGAVAIELLDGSLSLRLCVKHRLLRPPGRFAVHRQVRRKASP